MSAPSPTVEISARFRRSVRIDLDLEIPEALEGFYCPPSFASALSSMAGHIRETGQAAFTWTGPFGGGKSSLALVLAALVGGRPKMRAHAEAALGAELVANIRAALSVSKWNVLPLIGDRAPLADLLAASLNIKPGPRTSGKAVLSALSDATRTHGLLIIVDELGRTLDGATHAPAELDFLQDLAELAARSEGKLIFVGILHQAFDEYANRLQRDARDRWAKIQGRFIDLPIATAGEETLELLRRAINVSPKRQATARPVAERVARLLSPARAEAQIRRLADTLAGCAPLHPVSACLLGPLSRRRFGQNQRSVFSFLNSAERFGFQEFVRNRKSRPLLGPSILWDYLQANLEPSILASPDGRKWSVALDGLERIEAQGATEVHLELFKTIAVLDLFKDRSGLSPSTETLAACLDQTNDDFTAALKDLQLWSVVTFRRHSGSYSLFAGSDFDIEAAVSAALNPTLDVGALRSLADLQPRLAKRHHAKTGAMRWFDVSVALVADLASEGNLAPRPNAMGTIVLAIPGAGEAPTEAANFAVAAVAKKRDFELIVGLSDKNWRLADLARELAALETIQRDHGALAGDAAARREVAARIAELKALTERTIEAAFEGAQWFSHRRAPRHLSRRGVQELISDFADTRFSQGPLVLNELLNRGSPSSNAVAARTSLMKRMVLNEDEPLLGIEGYPAERGMYESLIAALNLRRNHKFNDPTKMRTDPGNLLPMWVLADRILAESNGALFSARTIYDAWGSAPIGLKEGLAPVFFVAYVQTRRDQLALYREGVFLSHFDELSIEFLARDPADLQIRRVEITTATRELLAGLAHIVGASENASPFSVAKALVAQFDALEPWTKRTSRLSQRALQLRDILKRAADPNRLLFDDLSTLVDAKIATGSREISAHVREGLSELRAAYASILEELKVLLLRELDVRSQTASEFERLRERAATVVNLTGDFRLNAFAGRLSQFGGTVPDMEGLAGLAADRLPRDWTDADREKSAMGLAELAQLFLHAESFARVKGRKARRSALALVVGVDSQPTPLFREFEVSDADENDVLEIVTAVEQVLQNAKAKNRNVILGALTRISVKYLRDDAVAAATASKRQRK